MVKRSVWERELSFLDLIELFVVKGMNDEMGLSIQSIRRAAAYLMEHHSGLEHPLASRRLETDGKDLFLRLGHERSAKADLINVSRRGQAVFGQVVKIYLRKIDFNRKTTLAERWWPLGRSVPVVLDPKIAFGAPHVVVGGIPTRALYGPISAGDDERVVANWFDVSLKEVRAAVQFERGLRREVA